MRYTIGFLHALSSALLSGVSGFIASIAILHFLLISQNQNDLLLSIAASLVSTNYINTFNRYIDRGK